MDLKANQRNEMEKTFSSEETQELVAAITFGKGLRNPMPGIKIYISSFKVSLKTLGQEIKKSSGPKNW